MLNLKPLCAAVAAASVIVFPCISSQMSYAAPASPSAPQGIPVLSTNDPHNYLHLTADQQKKINVIVTKVTMERQTLASDTTLSVPQKQQKFGTYVAQAQKQMKALLTPAQEALNQQREAQLAKYQKGLMDLSKKANAIQQEMAASMTPAQKKEIQSAQQSAAAKWSPIRDSKTLTTAQKQQQGKALSDQLNSTVLGLLTPKQKSWMDQLKSYQDEAMQLQRLAMNP